MTVQENAFNYLPPEYVKQYIYQYVGYAKERSDGRINGGCPICNEGNSWGRKARFWYDPEREGVKRTCKCYNCGGSWSSISFISTVSGLSKSDILEESKDYDIIPKELQDQYTDSIIKEYKIEDLPKNSINLLDAQQLSYYKDNDIVIKALKYLNGRKLLNAPNRPKTFYLSLTDFFHKNRIVIPYYENGKVAWYQTRKFLDNDNSPDYLSKLNSTKILYNVDEIDHDNPYIFVFEGAFKSMFIKNGTCSSGITEYNKNDKFLFTERQQEQLRKFPYHEIIWILDSPYIDKTARDKEQTILDLGYKLFKWPEALGTRFKDFDEIVVKTGKKISQEFILRNLYKNDFYSIIENKIKFHR